MEKQLKKQFKPVTTIEIVNAIEGLIRDIVHVNQPYSTTYSCNQCRERIEINRRIIVDGLRYHSAGAGVIAGEQ